MTDAAEKAKDAGARAADTVRGATREADGAGERPAPTLRRVLGRAGQRLRPWRPARVGGTLAFALLLLAIALRDRTDATLTAAIGFDLAPFVARVEGPWLEAVRTALPNPIVDVAAFVAGALPLAAALATGFALRSGTEIRTARLAWCAAAIVLPFAALLPLSEPAASHLVAIAPAADRLWSFAPFAWFDADRDALVSLPLTALFAAFLLARRAGNVTHARVWLALFVALAACAVTCGEAWFATAVLSTIVGLGAARVARSST